MNQHIVIIALLSTWSLLVAGASGATILLHEHAGNNGPVIYLGDVADISAATPSEVRDLSTTPLVPAPPIGTQEFLQSSQIRELLISRGLDPRELIFTGASVVEISNSTSQKAPAQAKPIPQLSPEEIEETVTAAILRHLISQTGHKEWQVELALTDANLRNLDKLGFEITASAGRSPWTGPQRFQIISASATEAISINAKVDRMQDIVVTLRTIQAGDLIGVADVEVRLQGGNLPGNVISSLDQVLGKEALRAIVPETVLQSNQIRAPFQVQRGETVEVFARTGGITVKTFAVVKQDGSFGDLVQVETLDRKEKFAARVSGWKQLDVLPTGATVADIATLHSATREQR